MSQGSGSGGGEPEAKALHTKRLYRAVVEAVHRLDLILGNKAAYQEVFKPENISLRNKLRELCVKLMFLHPVDYGRKAEELLWRKVYYEVIQLIKTNKKACDAHSDKCLRSTLECAYRTHLIAGIGFYQHLLLYIQSHYQLELQCCIDWTHVTDPLIGCKKPVSASEKEMDWAQIACHRCLVYLGDLARYQNELAGVDTELLAERFYYQALSVAPQIGEYLVLRESSLYDKAAKMYHQLKKCETRKLSSSKKRCKDIKRLLVSFMYLQSLFQPKSSSADSELTSLCQSVLEELNLCLFYLPSSLHPSSTTEEEEEWENGCSFLPDLLIFRMIVICLMSVHSLKRAGSRQYSAAIAFTLALFSHLINHVNIRLQAELEEGENPVPAFQNDGTEGPEAQETANSVERETEGDSAGPRPPGEPRQNDSQKGKKYSRLSCLRRRRRAQKLDESDLSEGFDSDSSPESTKASGASETGSEKSDEEAEAAFDMETDSDMNSQESRSDLEDMEEEETEAEGGNGQPRGVKNGTKGAPDLVASEGGRLPDSKGPGLPKTDPPEPVANGPGSLGGSEASIASNLQAMSTQLFQTKRCFRLAPTFSNVLLKPGCGPPAAKEAAGDGKPCINGDMERSLAPEPVGRKHLQQQVLRSSSLQEKLEIISGEGLLPTVKVFLDWLRTNTDLIIMCAEFPEFMESTFSPPKPASFSRRPARFSSPGLFLSSEVKSMLSGCELPDLNTCLLLPEDVALRNLPPLKSAHKRFNFEQDRPVLTEVEESVVRICCIRSFGHFITRLQGSILQYNSEVGIFISIAQSEQDGLLQQAQAQFRMFLMSSMKLGCRGSPAEPLIVTWPSRLQLEVSQLEGSLQQPKAQCVMSPYLVPDTQALCQHLSPIRQLAASGRFIVIIPRTVIDGLDFLKKEN
ncbi:putative To mCG8836 isoform 1 protein [Naja naja]|nr:putative To mCG8836 isoform 1 protein [Naja naja]